MNIHHQRAMKRLLARLFLAAIGSTPIANALRNRAAGGAAIKVTNIEIKVSGLTFHRRIRP